MDTSRIAPLALAVVQGHAIFLDCRADRYFALSPSENDAVLRLVGGQPISRRAQRAIAAAIGVEADAGSLRALMPVVAPAPVTRALIPDAAPGWPRRLAAIRHLVAAKTVLKLRGLHASLERLARPLPRGMRGTKTCAPGELERVVGAHDWLSRHLSQNDACLLRSLALACHVRSSGGAASFVIGVRVDPFAAHCWVRSGDEILNEDLDAVAAFAPILVVR